MTYRDEWDSFTLKNNTKRKGRFLFWIKKYSQKLNVLVPDKSTEMSAKKHPVFFTGQQILEIESKIYVVHFLIFFMWIYAKNVPAIPINPPSCEKYFTWLVFNLVIHVQKTMFTFVVITLIWVCSSMSGNSFKISLCPPTDLLKARPVPCSWARVSRVDLQQGVHT